MSMGVCISTSVWFEKLMDIEDSRRYSYKCGDCLFDAIAFILLLGLKRSLKDQCDYCTIEAYIQLLLMISLIMNSQTIFLSNIRWEPIDGQDIVKQCNPYIASLKLRLKQNILK